MNRIGVTNPDYPALVKAESKKLLERVGAPSALVFGLD